jgi:plasmid stabilization system protein ParE
VSKLCVYDAAALSIVEQADYYSAQADRALALKWETAVDEAIRALLRNPEMGSPCRFRSLALAGMRWTTIHGFPKHLIFYRYAEEEDTIFVIQILHGARDIDAIFGDVENTK